MERYGRACMYLVYIFIQQQQLGYVLLGFIADNHFHYCFAENSRFMLLYHSVLCITQFNHYVGCFIRWFITLCLFP